MRGAGENVPVILLTAWGGEGGALRLQNRYQELRDLAQRGPFGAPLSVQSEVRSDRVSAEVYGIIEHPFEEVKAALSTPASWCEFAPLHLNVKACTFQMKSHETLLTLSSRYRTGYGPENITRLRRFAIGVIKSKKVSSVAQKMRELTRNVRLVFDYLRMTTNSCKAHQ